MPATRSTGDGLADVPIASGALPKTYRDALVLSDVEGLPDAEIGLALGLSLPAVKSRLHRARLLLRRALAPHVCDGLPA